jgi:CRP-like cAMP-binding protein
MAILPAGVQTRIVRTMFLHERAAMLTGLFLKTHRTPTLGADDRAAFEAAFGPVRRYAARQTIVKQDVPLSQCTLLLDGIIQRFKDTEDGKRQILALHVPGDFVDLHSYPLKRLEHTVGTLTDVTVATVPHPTVRALTERSADLTELLWRSTLIDAAINREWLVSVGCRSGLTRVAHLFCEMFVRLDRIGHARGLTYDLPLTQMDVGDATGLTAVHSNRMLRALRQRGLMEFKGGRVTIHDWDALAEVAEFDPAYLFLD